MYDLVRELYPIRRSLTGDGVRESLRLVSRQVPLEVTEVPSGTQVYDWTVPNEWNIQAAWIADSKGHRIVDFSNSNLHVLGYSVPTRGKMALGDLRPHLHTIPEHPDWIPLRTSYHSENWGFCLAHSVLEGLAEDTYEVCIDSSLEPGHLTYAEAYVPGETSDEVLISTYICHPSVCNDGISGIALVTMLAKYLRRFRLKYSHRFLFSPGTIGPLTWLSRNEEHLGRVKHGLVASCVGDAGMITYKQTLQGCAEIDQAVANVLRASGEEHRIQPFVPWGGDERQFSSPGFRLPVGALMRTPPGSFPEYHTSADDLEFVRPEFLADSFNKYVAVLEILEGNGTYINLNPKGEPQLGRRGLYHEISSGAPGAEATTERAMLWVLSLSDGSRTLLDISDRSRIPFPVIRAVADALSEHGLLREERSQEEEPH
jgi:aminopeptidase-like protein